MAVLMRMHTHNVTRRTVTHTYLLMNRTLVQSMLHVLARFERCLPATASVPHNAQRRATVPSTIYACGTARQHGTGTGKE